MFSTNFREWLLFNEDAAANMDRWLGALMQYAKPEEKKVLDLLGREGIIKDNPPSTLKTVRDDFRRIIAEALAGKRKENMNWFAFALGYLSVKKFRKEDLEMALDALDNMKASGEILPSEIGARGWMLTGVSMEERMPAYLRSLNAISNRAAEKMRKSGDMAQEDSNLIRHIARSGDMDLYYLPPVSKEDLSARHRVLCKFGANTDWCTANPSGTYHTHYREYGIYILHRGGSPKYQFLACSDLPARSEEEDEEDDWEGQFMDVNDKPVKSLTPEEDKFIRKNGDAACYGIVSDGFDSIEEFLSAPDQKAKSLSGKIASEVIIMAGERAEEAILKMGEKSMMQISRADADVIIRSKPFGTKMADSILSALNKVLDINSPAENSRDRWISSDSWTGLEHLLAECIKVSRNPASEMTRFNKLMRSSLINKLFSGKSQNLDANVLIQFASSIESPRDDQFEAIITAAMRMNQLKKVFKVMVDKLPASAFATPRAYTYNAMSKIIDKAKSEKIDPSIMSELSKLLEDDFENLPPGASYWAIALSEDKDATAKRMLAKKPKDEWVRAIFSADKLGHLVDDSHVRQISRTRASTKEKLVDVARFHSQNLAGDETIKRFLVNADNLESSEVVEALTSVMDPEKFVDGLPQEIIDIVDEDGMKAMAERAEKGCRGGWGRNSKERGDCYEGKPLIGVLKRTRRHFPMNYLVFMKKGEERDGMIMKNMKTANPDGMRQAMDLAEDHDKIAEMIVKIRGSDMTPGEMLSVLIYASQEKFLKFLDIFGDKINSLDEPYASAYKDTEYERHGKYIDRMISIFKQDEKVYEILKRYKKELSPSAIGKAIRRREDKPELVRRMTDQIRRMDKDEYQQMLASATEHDHSTEMDAETMALIDDAKYGSIKEGETVIFTSSIFSPLKAGKGLEDAPNERFYPSHIKTNPISKEGRKIWVKEGLFKVVRVDGEEVEVTPVNTAKTTLYAPEHPQGYATTVDFEMQKGETIIGGRKYFRRVGK